MTDRKKPVKVENKFKRQKGESIKFNKNEVSYMGQIVKLKKVIRPKHIAWLCKQRTKTDRDFPYIISGEAGEGKSDLGINCSRARDKHYTHEENQIYSRNELMEKVDYDVPRSWQVDEAINVLFKRDWNKGGQKKVVQVLNICRSKKHDIKFIQPEFTDMDPSIRNTRIKLWIYVICRGLAVVFRPIKKVANTGDPWNLDILNKNVDIQQKKHGEFLGIIEGCFRTPNFLSFLTWDAVSEEDYKAYDLVKDKKKYDNEEEVSLGADDVKKAVRNKVLEMAIILQKEGLLKRGYNKHLARLLKISIPAVSSYSTAIKLGMADRQILTDVPKLE